MWKSLRQWLQRPVPTARQTAWESKWSSADVKKWNLQGVSRHYVDALEAGVLRSGDRCLDLGCGLGHSAAWLADRGLHMLGVDFAQAAIEQACALHSTSPRLEFRTLDVTAPCDQLGQFDAILDRGCLHGISERAGYYRNLDLWLKPGGIFLLQHHLRRYSQSRLRREVLRNSFARCSLMTEKPIEMLENLTEKGIPGVFLVVRKDALK
jgi:2-polyprenyl-3-methyl-5-hydroxy-6-metoxy-1,4-benzoquinol methylase